MASIAAVQAVLDPQGTGKGIQIVKSDMRSATSVVVHCEGGVEFPGRHRGVAVDPTASAAAQAAAIRAGMA